MKTNKKYYTKEIFRLITLILICAIFCIYTISPAINEQNISVKITFISIMILFISILIWAEYLRYLYKKAISKLNLELDPSTAMKIFENLNKKDLFKSYSKTFLIFKVLYNISIKNYTQSIEILDENEKFFRSSLDNLLIQKYTYFFCYYKLNQKEKVEKYYLDLQKLKNSKSKKVKVSPLYNWEFIDAIYFKAINNLQKSKYSFENTNTINMNRRELLEYLREYEELLSKLNLKEQEKKIKNKIKKLKEFKTN